MVAPGPSFPPHERGPESLGVPLEISLHNNSSVLGRLKVRWIPGYHERVGFVCSFGEPVAPVAHTIAGL
jgi:hypothetical protein